MTVPIKEGEIIKERCLNIGEKDDGIFKIDKFVIIVPNTIIGLEYDIKITKVYPKFAFWEAIKRYD